jgi:hypothetical protein
MEKEFVQSALSVFAADTASVVAAAVEASDCSAVVSA